MEKNRVNSDIQSTRRSKDHKSCETVTAIEIEIIRNNGLTDIITPINGTLGLFSEETIPDKIVDLFGQLERSKLLKLKGLSSKHRKNYILAVISTNVNSHKDRKVPGFISKRVITIKPKEDIRFLGTDYRKNISHEIDISNFVNPLLEYSASTRVKNAYGLEFHFRSKLPLNKFRNEIDTFFKQIIPSINGDVARPPDGTHQHIPAPLPFEYLTKIKNLGASDEISALSLTMYIQMLELAMIVYNKGAKVGLDVVFHEDRSRENLIDFMSRESLKKLFSYFLEISKGNSPVLNGSLKKCNAAVRSGDIYDGDDLWGIELRFNHFQTCSSEEQSLLSSSIKDVLSSQDFPIRLAHIKEYFSKSTLSISEKLKRTWFRGMPLEDLQEIENQRLRRALSELQLKINLTKFDEIDDFKIQNRYYFLTGKTIQY